MNSIDTIHIANGPLKGRIPANLIFPGSDPRFTVRYVSGLSSDSFIRVVETYPELVSADDTSIAETVVLIHGWGASSYSYSGVMPPLAGAGRRVIAVDMPGHGLSFKPEDDSVYDIEFMAGTVMAVIQQLGLEKFVLVGHSMGGAISALIASRMGESIERLVLVAPAGFERTALMKTASAATAGSLGRRVIPYLISRNMIRLLLVMAFGDRSRITQEDIDQYWAPSQYPGFGRAVRALLRQFEWEGGKTLEFEKITAPTTVMYSTKDNLVSENAAKCYADVIRNARLVRCERVGHAITDEDPESVVREVLRS